MTSGPFTDPAAFTGLRRITGLALSPVGDRLAVSVQAPDPIGSRYVTSLWEIPLTGGDPVRLTSSKKGEAAPVFTPDGRLLFTSSRPVDGDGADSEGDDVKGGGPGDTALWTLPRAGEASILLSWPGGLAGPVVARGSGHVLVAGSRLTHTPAGADDAARRATRKDRRISAILHDGMPIRYWDHELGDTSPRLLLVGPDGGAPVDLAPDVTTELINASYSISADAATVATSWMTRERRGRSRQQVATIDVASAQRTVHVPPDGFEYAGPMIAPDGTAVALACERVPTFDTPPAMGLAVLQVDGGATVTVGLDDLNPTEWAWSPDSATLFVSGDLHGRGAVVAVDPATGTVLRTLVRDATYLALQPADGALYALRSAVDSPPAPVRLDPEVVDQTSVSLPTPVSGPELPGRLVELDVPVGGGDSVHAWLCLPPESDAPHPVMQWIHGGPFLSTNSWSWRWNPWVAVAHGWAVILPDPALSTGYGQGVIDRAWPYRADVVWREIETVLDAVLERPDVDEARTALLGGSFGGFMTNWIAGHTDRFGAIVTHAGLWALDQQHATTDSAEFKTSIFGRPADHPEWYAQYSPHTTLEHISTPMLVVHGNRDYRVPVSEGLRLWWDLVETWPGEPADLPHRFLQFTGENHWVLSPANAEIWYETVLGFCAQHVLDTPWTPSPLL
ncbi:MAG: prolyl oligopeptidase family serine peptidase [Jatrophihabitans sp.]